MRVKTMDKKISAKVINGMAEKIEVLEDKINKLEKINLLNTNRNIKNMEHFENLGAKVEDLHSGIKIIKEMQKITKSKCDNLKAKMSTLATKEGVQKSFNECYDDLEAKNYQIKSDLDKLITWKNINALSNGEKTITLGELRSCKDWEELDNYLTDDIVISRDMLGDLETRQTEEQEIWLDENEDIFNKTMKEGHETIKRVKARKGENNEQ
jgi:hypothetical protein